jgi:hypothetical protein
MNMKISRKGMKRVHKRDAHEAAVSMENEHERIEVEGKSIDGRAI